MQAILNPGQTKIVLKSIEKLLQLYTMDQNTKTYPSDVNDFLSQFSKEEFRLLKSLVDIFRQSREVTFCQEVKKSYH